jgi:hypothetical protein
VTPQAGTAAGCGARLWALTGRVLPAARPPPAGADQADEAAGPRRGAADHAPVLRRVRDHGPAAAPAPQPGAPAAPEAPRPLWRPPGRPGPGRSLRWVAAACGAAAPAAAAARPPHGFWPAPGAAGAPRAAGYARLLSAPSVTRRCPRALALLPGPHCVRQQTAGPRAFSAVLCAAALRISPGKPPPCPPLCSCSSASSQRPPGGGGGWPAVRRCGRCSRRRQRRQRLAGRRPAGRRRRGRRRRGRAGRGAEGAVAARRGREARGVCAQQRQVLALLQAVLARRLAPGGRRGTCLHRCCANPAPESLLHPSCQGPVL